jgi:hypothetical protein
MVKQLLILLLLIVSNKAVYSQIYGNEWIDYDQTYYSFNILNSGVHKLDYAALSAAGIPLTTFSSENIQVFGRQMEVPLFIQDGGDASIDPGDYILFYADKNDGWLDSSLYDVPSTIGNPAYSLFNDTIKYFFTWNSSSDNLRFTEENDIDFTSYTPANFILQKIESNYKNYYNLGGDRISLAASSFYKGGEGFGLAPVNGVSNYTLTLSCLVNSLYSGVDAPMAKFKGISTTNSDADFTGAGNHHVQWKIGASNYSLYDQVFTGYKAVIVDQDFPSTELNNGSTPLKWMIVGDQGAASDYQSLNYWSIIYPKSPTLNGGYNGNFTVRNSTQSKVRLDFTNTAVSNPIVFVLGDTPKKALLTSYSGGYSTLFSNSSNGVDQRVIIQDFSTAISISTIQLVGDSGFFTDYSLTDPDSVLLMIYHPSLVEQSIEYFAYRQSPAGGGHNALLVNVEELYLQFGGGINKHINGIRRFAFFMYDRAAVKPVGLFLMGKGISLADNGFPFGTPGSRTNAASYSKTLIPTFGEPASDGAITGKVDGTTWVPRIPTGRIAVKTNQEMLDYLNKVKEYELQQDPNSIYTSAEKDWQKQIIHFGGGGNASQQATFQGYLNAMQETIEGAYFGGKVQRIFKSSSAPIDPNVLSGVTGRLQEGVSLMTFFGHASATGFDVNIDLAVNWGNVGKYPIVLGNSCYTGNMYANSNTPAITEQFVNVQNGGAIAFIGSDADGLDQPSALFSKELYHQFSDSSYGSTLGMQIQKTIGNLQLAFNGNLIVETTAFQMNLHGDPMIHLNWHRNPEIELTEERVSFLPDDLDLTVDSIEVTVVLTNLGKSIVDTFDLEIRRDFPLNTVDSIYIVKVPSLHYKDTIKFNMALQNNIGIGINNITISADIPSFQTEQYDEIFNNQVTKTLFIDIDGILPIVPYDFAVVPDDSVTVKASTINPIADFNAYRFEIDTTDLFNSPQWRYANRSGLGGVKEVNPSDWKFVSTNLSAPLVCTDSTVYFWRVALDNAPYDWRERSFQYIPGKIGWGQDHFFQFKKNGFYNLDYNRSIRQREFLIGTADTLKSIVNYGWNPLRFYLNGLQVDYGHCTGYPELIVAVFDPYTHVAWGTRYLTQNPNNDFGNQNDNGACRARPIRFFNFPTISQEYMDSCKNMLLYHIPDSFYILVYTNMYSDFDAWNTYCPSMYSVFDQLGSSTIYSGAVLPNLPFAFFCKKGDPSTVVEIFAQNSSETLTLIAPLEKKMFFGSETSTLIGPASRWGNVYWKQDPLEAGVSNDSTELHILAYDINRALQYQKDTLFTRNDSILDLNSIIDANLFPYIKLNADYVDTMGFTPAQIDRWHVLFDPLPEAAIDGTLQYTWIPDKDTLNEGENIKFAVDVKNIYSLHMDSILIKYWIEDAQHILHPIPYSRKDSLRVDQVLRDTIEFSTIGYVGINSLWMEVNPYINGSVFVTDQPEQEHFNNLLQIPFFVVGDDINPILDVTFDGRHILNGDIVSPFSELFITLKDDNPLLIMDNVSDTALFGIYLTDPLGVQKRIPFVDGLGTTVMQWIPADAQNKRFKIIYPGAFELDGKYTLLVQGTDRSGNLSGDIQYRVTFEIVRESSITHLMNYPNPFSTSTRFVFTLTGSELPENIIIQIMTITGKVVREITEAELGQIFIGRNITQFDWNGTDEFGDQLANGVYLYRVKAQINGEDIKHRESGADSYFTKNFGKMYLMR